MTRLSIVRLKLYTGSEPTLCSVCTINDKTLNSEIETVMISSRASLTRTAINDKTLNSEIETFKRHQPASPRLTYQ